MNKHIRLGACLAVIPLAACSGNSIQQSIVPKQTSPTINPITQSDLQFAVGTANIAGVVGLNTLITLRQTGTYAGTGILENAPTITGPTGFVIPAAPDAYADAGTASISAHIPTSIASPPPQTTFDPDAGGSASGNYLASSYGIFPGVVGNSGSAPQLYPNTEPFYASLNPTLTAANKAVPAPPGNPPAGVGGGGPFYYIGGPPAFHPPGHTSTQDGTFAGGVYGYTLGFAAFQATPVSGTYNLNVVIPTGQNQTTGAETYGNKPAAASLSATTVLPAWTTPPTFVSDGNGGGVITTNFAGGGNVSEEYIEVEDVGIGYISALSGTPANAGNNCDPVGSAPYFYTFKVTPGQTTVTVPDNIGPAAVGKAQGHTFCTAADNAGGAAGADPVQTDTGDFVLVYGFAVDYPLFNSAFPQSDGVPAPVIKSGSQDDVTLSAGSLTAE